MSQSELSKHGRIRQSLTQDIATGRYAAGQRLPSESALVKAFGASRPTVNRALRELQLSGVIERRAGSGSYVRKDPSGRGHVFGLLIPELGRTEIFEPICRGMADARHPNQHALLWGSSLADAANIEEQASQACAQLVEKKVAIDASRPSSTVPGFPWCFSIAIWFPTRTAASTTWSASTTAGLATRSPRTS
jgi:DNA-binding transcriptional MocR family regulator